MAVFFMLLSVIIQMINGLLRASRSRNPTNIRIPVALRAPSCSRLLLARNVRNRRRKAPAVPGPFFFIRTFLHSLSFRMINGLLRASRSRNPTTTRTPAVLSHGCVLVFVPRSHKKTAYRSLSDGSFFMLLSVIIQTEPGIVRSTFPSSPSTPRGFRPRRWCRRR